MKVSELIVDMPYYEHSENAWAITTDGITLLRYGTPSELERSHGVKTKFVGIWAIDD